MEFHPNDWLGRWQNFESYITSTDPYLQLAWQEAEAAAAALPMFKSGAKQFWQTACVTTSIGNPHTLGGWTITPADGGKLCIAWTDADGNTLGRRSIIWTTFWSAGLRARRTPFSSPRTSPPTGRSAACWQWSRCRPARPGCVRNTSAFR